MRELPIELLFLLPITFGRASARPARSRGTHSPCGGDLQALNIDGQSPWETYVQLTEPCNGALLNEVPSSSCKCNLVVYNVYMAYEACAQGNIESWSDWASSNNCNQSQTPTTTPYDTTNVALPNWAHQDLVNGQFDVNTAVDQSKSWSPIQIALPIIVGLIVALIAGGLFLWYRSRHQGAFRNRKRNQKPWQSAHLQAPRRFFGLLPQRVTVKERTVRTPEWEIDGAGHALDDEYDPAKDGRSSRASGHSRTTSSSALIQSDASIHSSAPRSLFNTIASKFSTMSLGRKYQNGAAKGADYRRVHVQPAHADARFKIDGELPPLPPLVPLRDEPQRESSLPSVLDISAPAAGARRGWVARSDSMPLSEDMRAPPTVMHSDFSLGTTDLMTPTSPSSGARSSVPPQHVAPGSPFMPAPRFEPMPPIRASPSPYIGRRESTDSLAHELYPRDPSYEY